MTTETSLRVRNSGRQPEIIHDNQPAGLIR